MATITAAARAIYPHDALPDDVYARVGEKLAEAAREDPGTERTIEDGVSALNGGRPFADLSADEQLEALKAIEGSDFFELVRSTAVVEVYSDQRTWQLVGYEGPSFDKGGYLDRGFNDLDWLPDPEAGT
jgi:Gluconate 2-dehydrogenase subunit 3